MRIYIWPALRNRPRTDALRPILLFHIGVERAWTLRKTWDLMQIPKPFTRAVLVIAPPLDVPKGADREAVEKKHQEMQRMLERVRDVAEGWFSLTEEGRKRERAVWNF